MATFTRSDNLRGAEFVEADLRGARFVGADLSGALLRGVEVQGADTLERVAAMPVGTVEVSVGGEWSFAQTLRHLVLATDMWLGRAVLDVDQPFHPLGLAHASAQDDGPDRSVLTTPTPSYDDVLEARAGRVAMVRDFIATVTPDELAATRRNPHDPHYPETTLSCLHTILEEEWEHHRYAVRDLEAMEETNRA